MAFIFATIPLDLSNCFMSWKGKTAQPGPMTGGFIKTDVPYRYFKKPRYGFVGDVYTMPQARKLGLAKDLSARVLDWLQRQDIDMVRLLASNNARAVYEKMGFQATNEMALDVTK